MQKKRYSWSFVLYVLSPKSWSMISYHSLCKSWKTNKHINSRKPGKGWEFVSLKVRRFIVKHPSTFPFPTLVPAWPTKGRGFLQPVNIPGPYWITHMEATKEEFNLCSEYQNLWLLSAWPIWAFLIIQVMKFNWDCISSKWQDPYLNPKLGSSVSVANVPSISLHLLSVWKKSNFPMICVSCLCFTFPALSSCYMPLVLQRTLMRL